MRLRKQVMAILLSAAMVVTSITVPGTQAKTAKAASTFDNLNQTQMTEAMGAGWNLGTNNLTFAVK